MGWMMFSHEKGIGVKSMQTSYGGQKYRTKFGDAQRYSLYLSNHSSYQPFVKPDRQSELK